MEVQLHKCFSSFYRKSLEGERGHQNPLLGCREMLNAVDKTALMTTEQGAGYTEHWLLLHSQGNDLADTLSAAAGCVIKNKHVLYIDQRAGRAGPGAGLSPRLTIRRDRSQQNGARAVRPPSRAARRQEAGTCHVTPRPRPPRAVTPSGGVGFRPAADTQTWCSRRAAQTQ